MQVLTSFLLAWVLCGVHGVIRTPLEAFRPTGEIYIRRPDKLPMLSHRRTAVQPQYGLKTLYQTGASEEDLPDCRPRQVCSRVALYDKKQPWIERKCRCLGHRPCSSDMHSDDGHSLADKTNIYKTCEPVKKLPKCRYFKDATWTIFTFPDSNATQQIVNCQCPKLSFTYMLKEQPHTTPSGEQGNQYRFVCSLPELIPCLRKEPCSLFSVRRRHEQIDDVHTRINCKCPMNHICPRRHTEPGVMSGVTYVNESVSTFHGYCMPRPSADIYRFVGDKD